MLGDLFMKSKYVLMMLICIALTLIVLTGCSKATGVKESPEPTTVADYNAQFEGGASEFEGEAIVVSPDVVEEIESIVVTTATPAPTFAPTPTPIPTPTTTHTVVITPSPLPEVELGPNVNEGASGEWE